MAGMPCVGWRRVGEVAPQDAVGALPYSAVKQLFG